MAVEKTQLPSSCFGGWLVLPLQQEPYAGTQQEVGQEEEQHGIAAAAAGPSAGAGVGVTGRDAVAIPADEEEGGDTCAICLSTIELEDLAIVKGCEHIYCGERHYEPPAGWCTPGTSVWEGGRGAAAAAPCPTAQMGSTQHPALALPRGHLTGGRSIKPCQAAGCMCRSPRLLTSCRRRCCYAPLFPPPPPHTRTFSALHSAVGDVQGGAVVPAVQGALQLPVHAPHAGRHDVGRARRGQRVPAQAGHVVC